MGLTAAAINTATSDIPNRSRVCVSDQSQAVSLLTDQSGARAVAERPATGQPGHVIAPRPSLGRVDAVMDTVSSLPDNLASLLVSDSASSAQFSSLLSATPDSASRQSRLASMFTSESPVPGTPGVSSGQEPSSLTQLQTTTGRLASLLASDASQTQLNNLLGTDIAGTV